MTSDKPTDVVQISGGQLWIEGVHEVVVGDALEPDIDVEQLPDVLIVRARVGALQHQHS